MALGRCAMLCPIAQNTERGSHAHNPFDRLLHDRPSPRPAILPNRLADRSRYISGRPRRVRRARTAAGGRLDRRAPEMGTGPRPLRARQGTALRRRLAKDCGVALLLFNQLRERKKASRPAFFAKPVSVCSYFEYRATTVGVSHG